MRTNPVDAHQKSTGLTQTEYAKVLGYKSINTFYYHRNHLTPQILSRINDLFLEDLAEQVKAYEDAHQREILNKVFNCHNDKPAGVTNGK